ncbi:hypothetical protein Psuf_091030 [Phytohabitans suffuscus]|uniref:Uncharacterized protein n=1 Tax=Phytohabitans suffuscus TaxID=624315 RepID=A0A6F8Z029_9ACTN|nr:hypothetical protein Psuf_091030 [Phytohabitans suffuscus]
MPEAAVAVQGLQVAALEVHHEGARQSGHVEALLADTHRLADLARRAVAPEHVPGPHLDPVVGQHVHEVAGHRVGVLGEGVEPHAGAQVDEQVALAVGAQDRLQVYLGDPLAGLGGLGAVVLLGDAPPLLGHRGEPPRGDRLGGEAGRPDHVGAVLGRDARGADVVGDAELPEELHAAGVDEVQLRMDRRLECLVDEHAGHALAGESQCGDHADRARAHDQNRYRIHVRPPEGVWGGTTAPHRSRLFSGLR